MQPADIVGWTSTLGVLFFAVIGGLFVAAVSAARHGGSEGLGER